MSGQLHLPNSAVVHVPPGDDPQVAFRRLATHRPYEVRIVSADPITVRLTQRFVAKNGQVRHQQHDFTDAAEIVTAIAVNKIQSDVRAAIARELGELLEAFGVEPQDLIDTVAVRERQLLGDQERAPWRRADLQEDTL